MAKPPSSKAGVARAGQARAGYINSDEKADNPPPREPEPVTERLPPLPQNNSFEVAAQVVRHNAEQQRRRGALIGSMGFNTSAFNQAPISSGPISGGGGRLSPQGAIYRDTAIVAPASASVSDEVAALLEKLRGFQTGIQKWVGELRASMPNDPQTHSQYVSLIDFLERLSSGIVEVADGLDQAINAGTNGAPEPILLGKAAIVARNVSEAAQRWLDEQGTNIIDVPVKLSIFGGALITLSHFGISGDALTSAIAGFILGTATKK